MTKKMGRPKTANPRVKSLMILMEKDMHKQLLAQAALVQMPVSRLAYSIIKGWIGGEGRSITRS